MKITAKKLLNTKEKLIIDTKNMSFLKSEDFESEIEDYPDAGFFDFLNDELVMLISFDSLIYIYFNNTFHLFKKENFDIDYKVNKYQAQLSFKNLSNNSRYELLYSTGNMDKVSSIYYSEEEEDVNFGLWIYNVLSNNERIEIIKKYSPKLS